MEEANLINGLLLPLAVAGIVWLGSVGQRIILFLIKYVRARRARSLFAESSLDEDEFIASLKNYVKPKGCRVDPAIYPEPREALAIERFDLFTYVDTFLSTPGSKYLFVLADSGMGKTTFLINFFYKKKATFFSRSRPAAIISLAKRNAELRIDRIPHEVRRETVLLLDALDEDPQALQGMADRVDRIIGAAEDFKAIVIACRSQFFATDGHIPVATGIVRAGPTRPSESKEYSFERVYIAPFDDTQINQYLKQEFPGIASFFRRRAARGLVQGVPYLSVRPMLLAHIRDVMALGVGGGSTIEVYQAMVNAWVQREHSWVNKEELLIFSKLLAFHIFTSRAELGAESCPPGELGALAESWGIRDIPSDHLTSRSLLNRGSDGAVKFSHRSIMEFFVSEALLSQPAGLQIGATDQVVNFLLQRLGCTDGRCESVVIRQAATVRTIAPEIRLGYPTNFSLFTEYSRSLEVSHVYGIRVRSAVDAESQGVLGDFVQSACAYAESGSRAIEVRLNAYPSSDLGAYANGYLSVWFEDRAVIARILVHKASLLSACSSIRRVAGEVTIIGRPTGRAAGAPGLSWNLATRCGLTAENAIDLSPLTNSRRVSYLCSDIGTGIDLNLLSVSESGSLAGFGIVGGGSSFAVRRQKMVRLPRREEPVVPSARTIEPIVPLVPAAERWFKDGR